MSASPARRLNHVFLEQGEIHAAAEPTVISTILGSCVAVCLCDPVAGVGGMNHFVLARGGEPGGNPRYGDSATAALVEAMLELGASPRHLVAKVFGGGSVLPSVETEGSIGVENMRVARQELRRHRIPVVAHSTGGRQGLVIRMYTASGDILVRRLGVMTAPRPGA